MSEAQRLRDIEGSIRALGIRQEVVERRLGKLDGFQDTVITVEEKKAQDLIDAEYKRIAQRDQFAMAALQGLCSKPETSGSIDRIVNRAPLIAAEAYSYADAMMAERRKTMFEAAEEQKPTTAQGVSANEALRQLVGYVEDMCGHGEVRRMLQPNSWAQQPDHPMMLARAALEAGRGKSVHYAGDKDGWVEWAGGKCPVATNTAVDVKFRNGTIAPDFPAGDWGWRWIYDAHEHNPGDIVAYRVVRP